jgi:hypothetical protein
MTTFDERESTFESKFAHDAELQFRVEARANKLLGLWAAELLGKSGDEAAAFATEVIKSDFEEPGNEDVFRKVSADLGSAANETLIRSKMAEFAQLAKTQIMEES